MVGLWEAFCSVLFFVCLLAVLLGLKKAEKTLTLGLSMLHHDVPPCNSAGSAQMARNQRTWRKMSRRALEMGWTVRHCRFFFSMFF